VSAPFTADGAASPIAEGDTDARDYDAIIIGSGFGGAMCAHVLVSAGWRVLMIERGDWVPRGPRNWATDQAMDLAPAWHDDAYATDGPLSKSAGAFFCVGGPSVFYGAASVRYRTRDFEPDPAIAGESGARWPFGYDDLEPWYGCAERLIGVVGDDSDDPTAPPRSGPRAAGPPLSAVSRRIGAAGRALGLTPSILPLAINWAGTNGRPRCARCLTCDAYACAIGAKNDIATAVLPALLGQGLTLLTNTVVVRLQLRGRSITRVDCVDARSGAPSSWRAAHVVLAAGALASPHIALASGLDRLNPAGRLVGRFLMRHCNALVYGVFPEPPVPDHAFHKQLAFFDAYFGHPSGSGPAGKLGCVQQIHAPPAGLVGDRLPRPLRPLAPALVRHAAGLLVIAEDQPRIENGIRVDSGRTDVHGLPRARVTHRYTRRDLAARRALVRMARAVLREAGAFTSLAIPIRTFSHAIGTLRMGADPLLSPVDPDGRFRGIHNLWVADGSTLPSSAAVNPSLTIAANALRIASRMANADGHAVARIAHDPAIVRIEPSGTRTGVPGRHGAAAGSPVESRSLLTLTR
jgi:choline dehydrogenase-like flavoprotein